MTFGGPGVGKSSGIIADVINKCTSNGQPCFLGSSVQKVRNAHVSMLLLRLGVTLFERRVRVIGSRNLDELARSRTLPVFVNRDMMPHIVRHEQNLSRFAEVVDQISMMHYCMRKLPREACSLFDLFADVSISLARLHWVVGRGRCELDELVTAVTRQVKEPTTTVVGTVGAATRPRGAADVGFPPGVSLSVLAIDEATRTDRFQLDRLFVTLKR